MCHNYGNCSFKTPETTDEAMNALSKINEKEAETTLPFSKRVEGVVKSQHLTSGLNWVQKTAITDEKATERKAIPGTDQATTRTQLLGFFKDGDVLVKLANVLEPGAIEIAAAEENANAAAQKEVQKKNIDSLVRQAVFKDKELQGKDKFDKEKFNKIETRSRKIDN